MLGDDDVAVGRLAAGVDHPAHVAAGHHHHHALAGDHGQGHPGHAADLARPGAGRVDHPLAADGAVLAGDGVVDPHGGDPVAVPLHPDQRVADQHLAATGLGVGGHRAQQRPGVDAAVGHGEGQLDVRGQQRLAPVGGRLGQLLGGDARGPAALHELVRVGLVVPRQQHEQAADVLDGVGGDAAQGGVLLDALPGRLLVADGVAGPGVEQAVPAARGPGAEVEALDQHRVHAPQGQVAQDGHAGHPAAHHHDVGLHHMGQGLRSRSRPVGGSNSEFAGSAGSSEGPAVPEASAASRGSGRWTRPWRTYQRTVSSMAWRSGV